METAKVYFRIISIVLFFLLLSNNIVAQENIIVSGTILSIENNKPLSDINIEVEGIIGLYETADKEGKFSIEVPSRDVTLLFSYPGYKNFSFYLNGETEFVIKMIPEGYPSTLDDIVLASGTKQKRFIAQSCEGLSDKDLRERPYSVAEKLLAGQVPGLNVTAYNGATGAGAFLNIRGLNSIYAGNQPLYIIDGMEISDISPGIASVGVINSQLLNLNPEDIESITVLKDASAKALYGARGTNGVILIETYKGKKGSSVIDFTMSMGSNKIDNTIPIQNSDENRTYLIEMANFQLQDSLLVNSIYGDYLFNDTASSVYQKYNNSTNWPELMKRNGYYGNYHFRIRGGDEVSKYAFSVGLNDQKGVIVNTGMQRLSARFNLDYIISDKLRIGNNLSFTRVTQDHQMQADSRYNPLLLSLKKSPITTPFIQNNEGVNTPSYEDYDIFGLSNPLAIADNIRNEYLSTSISGILFGEYKLFNKILIYSSVGLDNFTQQERVFIPATGVAQYKDMERTSEQTYNANTLIDAKLEAKYQEKLNYIHNISALIGGQLINHQLKTRLGRSYNSPGDDFISLGQGSILDSLANNTFESRMLSVYGNLDYAFKEKYLVNATLRVDGSSRFGISNRFIVFPVIGIGWRINNEEFMGEIDWIDELKLRVSYGRTGNDNIGNYTSRLLYLPANYKNLGGVVYSQLANEKLKPEITGELNAGIDLSIFNQKVNITVDVYDNTNTNMLVFNNLPLEVGFTNAFINNGKMNNKGLEIGLDLNFSIRNIEWNFGANLCYNKNKITELPVKTPEIEVEYSGFTALAIEGQPLGVYYGYKTEGVFTTDEEASALINGDMFSYTYEPFKGGDIKFKDLNNDGVIDANDKTYLGKAMPDLFGGIHTTIGFKGFEISALVDMQLGREVINAVRYELESMSGYSNQGAAVNRRWMQEGDITDMPRLAYDDPTGNNRFSDRYIEDGSFIRLRNIRLSYDFPRKIIKNIFLKKLRIFAGAENLLTISSYPGYDPEFFNLYNDFLSVDYASIPVSRFYSAGITIGL
jgi:TonB-linked SusC/RagA family outer membrane protein